LAKVENVKIEQMGLGKANARSALFFAAVALGKVTNQVEAIVENAGHFDYAVFAATIEEKMNAVPSRLGCLPGSG
jgi:hypothetical protein